MIIEKTLEKAIEYHKYNWLEEAEKMYRAVLAEMPDHPDANHRLGNLAMQVNKPEMALPFFEKVLKISPEDPQYQESLANAKAQLNTISSVNQKIENHNIFESRGNDFIYERKIQSLENKVQLLNDKFNNLLEALNYLDVFKMKNIDDPSSRMLAVELVDKKSTKTLMAFGGMASGLSLPPKEFFKSFVNENINIVFIKDFRQCWYQKGLLGKSKDIDSTVLYLKNIIPETTKELITIGASAGGYAAIRFGVALNADRVLAFSPQTLIDEETVRVFAKHCIKDMIFDNHDLDLRKILEKHIGDTNIEVYYGKYNNRDRSSVEHIKGYVEEFSYETGDHLIASFLKERGLLKEILDSIYEN